MICSPWFGHHLIGNWRPGRLAVSLLFKFPVKHFFDVVHVERTHGRTGDAEKKEKACGANLIDLNTLYLLSTNKPFLNK